MFSSLHSTTQQQLDCSPSQCSTRRRHHHQEERKHMETKNEEKESLDIHKVPKRKSPEHSETERVLKQVKIVPNEKAGELGFHRSSNNKDCTRRRMCNHPPHVFQPFCQPVRLLSHLHSTIALGLLLSQISNISLSLYRIQIQHLRSLRKKICQSVMKALRRGKNKPVVGVVSRSAAMCVTCHLLGVPLRSSSPIGTDDDTPPFFFLLRNSAA